MKVRSRVRVRVRVRSFAAVGEPDMKDEAACATVGTDCSDALQIQHRRKLRVRVLGLELGFVLALSLGSELGFVLGMYLWGW